MKTPFTTEQFFNVFEKYNIGVFPIQILFILAGMLALFILHSNYSFKNKFIGCFLGFLWLWIGLIYHIKFFTSINKPAFVFGAIFIVQGLLLLIITFSKKLDFVFIKSTKHYIAYFFIAFGLIIYPVIGFLAEGSIYRTISLGLPCPSTIFTFGFLMLANNKFPKYLLIIPSLWAIIGLSAAINFGVYQDFMILIAAITADFSLIKSKK
jgi:hypothetical protein